MKKLSVGLIILTLSIPIFSSCSSNNAGSTSAQSQTHPVTVTSIAKTQAVQLEKELVAEVQKLPVSAMVGENALFEIKNPEMIAQISEIIPDADLYLSKSLNLSNIKESEVYQAVIPVSSFLEKSIGEVDELKGVYSNVKDLGEFVKLLRKDPQIISKLGYAAKSVSNVMNIASIVSGDFNMYEIKENLKEINSNVSKISEFQQREFKSRIMATLSRVEEISEFSSEILNNEEQRQKKLQTLEDLKGEAIELIEQVNMTITDISNSTMADFKAYENQVRDFEVLTEYQKVLTGIMEEISKMDFLIANGSSSSEMSYSSFHKYLEKSKEARTALINWQTKHLDALGIDLENNRVSKKGIEGVASVVPGVFDKNWNYKTLEDQFVQLIKRQLEAPAFIIEQPKGFYEKDLVIIIKEGKYYYLTASN